MTNDTWLLTPALYWVKDCLHLDHGTSLLNRESLIKVLNATLNDGITLLDSRHGLMFRMAVDRGVEDKFLSSNERANFLKQFSVRQQKLFSEELKDKNGKPIFRDAIGKSGNPVNVPSTIRDLLEFDKDEVGNEIQGTQRIKDGMLDAIYPDGSTKPATVPIPNNAKEYEAYRAEMYKRHKEQQGKVTKEQERESQSPRTPETTTSSTTAPSVAQYPNMSPSPIAWVLMLLVGVLSGLWAQRKGYNFLCWMFAAAGSFFTCFLVLPFLKDASQVSVEDRDRTIRNGNITGIVLSCAYPAILLLLGLSLVGK